MMRRLLNSTEFSRKANRQLPEARAKKAAPLKARLLSFPWQLIEENPNVIDDDFQKSPFRGQSEETVLYPGVRMVGEESIVVGEAVAFHVAEHLLDDVLDGDDAGGAAEVTVDLKGRMDIQKIGGRAPL